MTGFLDRFSFYSVFFSFFVWIISCHELQASAFKFQDTPLEQSENENVIQHYTRLKAHHLLTYAGDNAAKTRENLKGKENSLSFILEQFQQRKLSALFNRAFHYATKKDLSKNSKILNTIAKELKIEEPLAKTLLPQALAAQSEGFGKQGEILWPSSYQHKKLKNKTVVREEVVVDESTEEDSDAIKTKIPENFSIGKFHLSYHSSSSTFELWLLSSIENSPHHFLTKHVLDQEKEDYEFKDWFTHQEKESGLFYRFNRKTRTLTLLRAKTPYGLSIYGADLNLLIGSLTQPGFIEAEGESVLSGLTLDIPLAHVLLKANLQCLFTQSIMIGRSQVQKVTHTLCSQKFERDYHSMGRTSVKTEGEMYLLSPIVTNNFAMLESGKDMRLGGGMLGGSFNYASKITNDGKIKANRNLWTSGEFFHHAQKREAPDIDQPTMKGKFGELELGDAPELLVGSDWYGQLDKVYLTSPERKINLNPKKGEAFCSTAKVGEAQYLGQGYSGTTCTIQDCDLKFKTDYYIKPPVIPSESGGLSSSDMGGMSFGAGGNSMSSLGFSSFNFTMPVPTVSRGLIPAPSLLRDAPYFGPTRQSTTETLVFGMNRESMSLQMGENLTTVSFNQLRSLGMAERLTEEQKQFARDVIEETIIDEVVGVPMMASLGGAIKPLAKTTAKTAGKALAKIIKPKAPTKAIQQTQSGFGVTSHGVSRKIERGVKSSAELDALKNPLKVEKVKIDSKNRASQRYIGKEAEVVVNPDTKKIVSTNPTATNKKEKLQKQTE